MRRMTLSVGVMLVTRPPNRRRTRGWRKCKSRILTRLRHRPQHRRRRRRPSSASSFTSQASAAISARARRFPFTSMGASMFFEAVARVRQHGARTSESNASETWLHTCNFFHSSRSYSFNVSIFPLESIHICSRVCRGNHFDVYLFSLIRPRAGWN
jgi:hypothetical protein